MAKVKIQSLGDVVLAEIDSMLVSARGNNLESKITPTDVKRYNALWLKVNNISGSNLMPPKIDKNAGPIAIINKDLISSLEKLLKILEEKLV